jgi:hypothetical protein
VRVILDILLLSLHHHLFLFLSLYFACHYHLRHPQKEQQRNFDCYMEWPVPFQLTFRLVIPSLYYVSSSPLSFVLMLHNPHLSRQNHSSLPLLTQGVVEKVSDIVKPLFLRGGADKSLARPTSRYRRTESWKTGGFRLNQ